MCSEITGANKRTDGSMKVGVIDLAASVSVTQSPVREIDGRRSVPFAWRFNPFQAKIGVQSRVASCAFEAKLGRMRRSSFVLMPTFAVTSRPIHVYAGGARNRRQVAFTV